MFVDEAIVEVKAGNGGRGCVSWRREKYVPMGGPDGGNGGRGGDIFLVADANTDTLSTFSNRRKFEAKVGRFGMGQHCAGKDGADLELLVPPGTIITELPSREAKTGKQIGELLEHGDRMLLAAGGRGGYGNAHFKSSTRQRPDFAELGEPGEQKIVKLELKLVADVGIIGYPSVGKSTLISVMSAARPKIAPYPFTTLVPNLGVCTISGRSFVLCDVPGLIEGASEGKGLGDAFLKHIERCGVLLHVLDLSRTLREDQEPDPSVLLADYRAIRKELETFSPTLAGKRELVILNKVDVLQDGVPSFVKALKSEGIHVCASVSAATRHGIDDLQHLLLPIVLEERLHREKERMAEREQERKVLPVLQPHLEARRMGAYRIEKKEDGSILIRGERLEQLTNMTDFSKEGGVQRFMNVLERVGILKSLQSLWDRESPVFIGGKRVDEYLN